MLVKSDKNHHMMVLKEQTRNRGKIFHVCEPFDIASIKSQRELEDDVSKKQEERKSFNK